MMPTPSETNLPPDMLMMLGRMDGKLDNVLQQLSALSSRTDDHEKRLVELEKVQGQRIEQVKVFEKMIEDVDHIKTWRSEIEGSAKGIGLGWKILGALATFVGGAGAMVGVQAVAPHKQIAKSELTVERSYSAPAPVAAN